MKFVSHTQTNNDSFDDDDDFFYYFRIHSHPLIHSFIEWEKKDSLSSQSENHETNLNAEDSYANLLKDADKLKLMLLAWNYQNSAAIRNNANGPDLTTMTNLWEQYQNALSGINVTKSNDGAIGSPVSVLLFKHTFFRSIKVIRMWNGQGR